MADKKNVSSAVSAKPEVMKVANEVRAKAGSLSDEKRDAWFARGMSLIYGGSSRAPAKTGRS